MQQTPDCQYRWSPTDCTNQPTVRVVSLQEGEIWLCVAEHVEAQDVFDYAMHVEQGLVEQEA